MRAVGRCGGTRAPTVRLRLRLRPRRQGSGQTGCVPQCRRRLCHSVVGRRAAVQCAATLVWCTCHRSHCTHSVHSQCPQCLMVDAFVRRVQQLLLVRTDNLHRMATPAAVHSTREYSTQASIRSVRQPADLQCLSTRMRPCLLAALADDVQVLARRQHLHTLHCRAG